MTAVAPKFAKLLIVDDHAPTRKWLRSTVSFLAKEIWECGDGAEAVRTYTEEQPDWVLMDFEMLPMNGLTATRLIKTNFPNARILIVSNHDGNGLPEAAMEAGAVQFLKKEDLWRIPEVISSLSQP
jgi:two-component system, NarL family, response regulator DegU